jgi:peptidoglycan-associated lipoprotein
VRHQKWILAVAVTTLATLLSTGCAKKAAQAQPPASPPAPPSPTATLAANPAVIQQGQTTTLTWQTSNASDITIEGVGTLPASGSRTVTPSESTTYNLVAKGPGGTTDASARVTVNRAMASSSAGPSDADLFAKNVKDVYFDYDKADIRPSEERKTEGNVAFFQDHQTVKFLIEGHCDDRGSEEYNLALGTSRAESVKQSLVQHGVSADRIRTISYGKERPFCTEDNEQCWQLNRVGHILFQQ